MLLILSYAISQGRRVALATVAGGALGDLVAMSASLAGLGALVLASSKLFILLKWVGRSILCISGSSCLGVHQMPPWGCWTMRP